MKQSYQLLSIEIDGLALPLQIPAFEKTYDSSYWPNLYDEYSLFDYPDYQREVSGSELLSCTLKEIDRVILSIPYCRSIIIRLDYFSFSDITNILFLKRVLQVIGYLEDRHPKLLFKFISQHEDYYKKLLEDIRSPSNVLTGIGEELTSETSITSYIFKEHNINGR